MKNSTKKTNTTTKKVNISDNDLLTLDLNNLDSLLNKVNIKEIKEKRSKESIYKLDSYNTFFNTDVTVITKKERTKIRRTRNKLIDNIFYFAKEKDNELLNKELKSFQSFYKTIYILNDYSLNSLCANNSDNETKVKIKTFLELLKVFKIK